MHPVYGTVRSKLQFIHVVTAYTVPLYRTSSLHT